MLRPARTLRRLRVWPPRPCATRSTETDAADRRRRANRSRPQMHPRGPQTAIVAACLFLSLAGCGRSPVAPPPAATQQAVLLRGNGTEPDTLDPQKARTA